MSKAKASRAVADPEAIAKAHAVYTPLSLSVYDATVHGLSNRVAWACPTAKILELYTQNLTPNHLEAAVGTGFFLDRAGIAFDRLVLLDINTHCLDRAAKRLRRFRPERREANLLAPLTFDLPPFRSVGLTYVLHCLPGSLAQKLVALDYLKPVMAEDAVLFGATILGADVSPNAPARVLLDIYNRKGVFNNRADDFRTLRHGLERRFARVDLEQRGLVALFRAR